MEPVGEEALLADLVLCSLPGAKTVSHTVVKIVDIPSSAPAEIVISTVGRVLVTLPPCLVVVALALGVGVRVTKCVTV